MKVSINGDLSIQAQVRGKNVTVLIVFLFLAFLLWLLTSYFDEQPLLFGVLLVNAIQVAVEAVTMVISSLNRTNQ